MISEVDWFQRPCCLRRNESLQSLFMKSTLDVQILAYLTSYSRYPGHSAPFSKCLRRNNQCVRFDKAPRCHSQGNIRNQEREKTKDFDTHGIFVTAKVNDS